jgi:hypothetical protein
MPERATHAMKCQKFLESRRFFCKNQPYFFDVSKPMGATKNVAKAFGVWPKDID